MSWTRCCLLSMKTGNGYIPHNVQAGPIYPLTNLKPISSWQPEACLTPILPMQSSSNPEVSSCTVCTIYLDPSGLNPTSQGSGFTGILQRSTARKRVQASFPFYWETTRINTWSFYLLNIYHLTCYADGSLLICPSSQTTLLSQCRSQSTSMISQGWWISASSYAQHISIQLSSISLSPTN